MKRTVLRTKIGEPVRVRSLTGHDGTDRMTMNSQERDATGRPSAGRRRDRVPPSTCGVASSNPGLLLACGFLLVSGGCAKFGRYQSGHPLAQGRPSTVSQADHLASLAAADIANLQDADFAGLDVEPENQPYAAERVGERPTLGPESSPPPSYAVRPTGYRLGDSVATSAGVSQAAFTTDSAPRGQSTRIANADFRGGVDDRLVQAPADDVRYTARQFPESGPAVGSGASGPVDFGDFGDVPNGGAPVASGPRVREADLIVQGYPARTGRITLGGAVNSDAGVTGQITIDERNFDILRWPTSFQDLASGTAFRGAGQTFRLEAAPGNEFQRYTGTFSDPNLFGFLPVSMSVSGFLFDRRFNDWDEERLGGRLSLGYRLSSFLSISAGISGQQVEITRPRILGVQQLDDVLGGSHGIYSGEISLKHDTRNTPLQASSGHYFEFSFEEVFGDFDYSRFNIEYRKYMLLNERVDGTGKQTLSFSTRLGFSGDETPIFENYFAGGYATMRGFDFRGASPQIGGVEVGGRFQFLNSIEYMFPLTADDAFRGVLFTDFGTVEQDIDLTEENFRVAPGFGFRIAIPALGPAPLAFDFAFPVASAETDEERVFSFYMSAIR